MFQSYQLKLDFSAEKNKRGKKIWMMREREIILLSHVCLHPCMGKLVAQFRQACVTTRKKKSIWTNTPQQLSAPSRKIHHLDGETERDNITWNFTTGTAWENYFQVFLHLHAKSIIQHQLSLKKISCLQPFSNHYKKPQISVVLSLPSDGTFGTSHCTSDHGQRVVVCLGCRCQSWCRTKGSTELATLHEYFTQTAERPAERMSAEWSSSCVYTVLCTWYVCALLIRRKMADQCKQLSNWTITDNMMGLSTAYGDCLWN